MPKSITIVTRVGGKEVVVGRCHPGQARILRKNGMATWSKSKLLLTGSGSPKTGPRQEWAALLQSKQFQDKQSWREEIEEIDPEGLLLVRSRDPKQALSSEFYVEPVETTYKSIQEWVDKAKSLRNDGKTLSWADEPRRLMMGYACGELNQVFFVGVRRIHQISKEDWGDLGISRETFSTEEGRRAFLGLTPKEPFKRLKGHTLEDIWVQEVEETLGADYRRKSRLVLEGSQDTLDRFADNIIIFDSVGAAIPRRLAEERFLELLKLDPETTGQDGSP